MACRGAGHVAVAGRVATGRAGGGGRAVPAAAGRRLAGRRRCLAGARLPYHRALALGCGDQDQAALEALALLDGLGARQTAQRLRRRLRQRGNRHVPRGPTRATAANPAGLTGRQVEVLGLLAQGLSNAEIAARLSLSAKTVEHHVSALLAKLGVGSRREAAAAARRLGVAPAKE
ncbi:MAG TPA: helix-turn-helix transcriptional regulator [Actinomycetota bacterium]